MASPQFAASLISDKSKFPLISKTALGHVVKYRIAICGERRAAKVFNARNLVSYRSEVEVGVA